MNELERLLLKRYARLRTLRSPRRDVAQEDWTRCRQGWKKPWYHINSEENGYPPSWLKR